MNWMDLKETTLPTPLSTIPSNITNMVKPPQKAEGVRLVSRRSVVGEWWGRPEKLHRLAPGLLVRG